MNKVQGTQKDTEPDFVWTGNHVNRGWQHIPQKYLEQYND